MPARASNGPSVPSRKDEAQVREHWEAGRTDMAHTLHDPRWIAHRRADGGVHVFDLTSESRPTSIAHHLTPQGKRS